MPRRQSPFNLDQRKALQQASTEAIANTLGNTRRHFASSCWLEAGNPYLIDCIDTLRQPGHSINRAALSEYISISASLHCSDGWSFLGRALDACSRSDVTTCVHLAYYAELRAAMSLLATEGIGIFNDRHFVVTALNRCKQIGRRGRRLGTHQIAWFALEYWATLQKSSKLLRQVIKPGGIPMGTWLDAFGASTTSRVIATKWLRTWGLDLKQFSEGTDRTARNQASYRPTRIYARPNINTIEITEFIRNLWKSFEPQPNTRFEILDRYLLRLSIEKAYDAKHPSTRRYFDAEVSLMLKTVIGDAPLVEEWKQFFTKAISPQDLMIITEASKITASTDPRYHLQILSRANLLLRVATGACAKLFAECSFGRTELEFWWKPFGEERGLWNTGDDPSEFMDLWNDIDDAVNKLDGWESANRGSIPTNMTWKNDLQHEISVLGECERIALWGLGL